MAVFDKIQVALGRKTVQADDEPIAVTTSPDNKDEEHAGGRLDDDTKEPTPSEDVTHGVKAAQAVTLTWSKNSLIAVFILYVLALPVPVTLTS